MRVRGFAAVSALAAVLSAAGSCTECTGTVGCETPPELSYSGQVIDHRTGAIVGHTRVAFVRDSGVWIDPDSVEVVANAEGFFRFRVDAAGDGRVHGHLRIAAPAPYEPYVAGLSLQTTRIRGDGAFLGRITAAPFLVLIGVVRDRTTLRRLRDVRVTMRRISGGRLEADTISFTSDGVGQFSWYPRVVAAGTIRTSFEIEAPGHDRRYRFERDVPLSFRDGEELYLILPVGMGLPIVAITGRRGVGVPVPGTRVEQTLTGGVAAQPSDTTFEPTEFGVFNFPFRPQVPGTLFVRLRIVPPAPLPAETRQVTLVTSDDDITQSLGFMGVGAHAYFGVSFRDEATGALLPEGTPVSVRRVGGLPIASTTTHAEGEVRFVTPRGTLEYGAPTADTGQMVFDLTVRHPAPFAWDTIRGVTVRSRFNDTIIDLGSMSTRKRMRP